MPRPTSRAALLAAMDATNLALVREVGLLPEDTRDRPGACAEWSVKDILAHLDVEPLRLGARPGPQVPQEVGLLWPGLNTQAISR